MTIPDETFRLGVIGAGKMGSLHLRKALADASVSLVGFFDPDAQRAQSLSAELGVTYYERLENLLFEAEGVIVASPTATHHPITRAALLAGAHVLVEKPITEEPAQAEELIALAAENARVLQVGFLERFRLRAMLRGFDDEPREVKIDRLTTAPGREPSIDVVSDLMIHDLDLLHALVPLEPIRMDVRGRADDRLLDEAEARFEFPSGVAAVVRASRIADRPERGVQLRFSGYDLHLNFLGNERRLFRDGAPPLVETFVIDPLAEQLAHFVACARGKDRPLVDGAQGLRALNLANAIRTNYYARGGSAEVTIERGNG